MSFVPPKTDSLENTAWNSEAVQEDLRNHILKASALWRQPHRHQSVWRYPCFNYDINGKRKVSILQDLNWEHTSMESKPDFNKSGIPYNERHSGTRCSNRYRVFCWNTRRSWGLIGVELIDWVGYIEKKEKCQGDAKTLNRIRQSTHKTGNSW